MFAFLKKIKCCCSTSEKKKYKKGSIIPIDGSDKRNWKNYYT